MTIKRREFVTLIGGAAAWPLAARAQQPERMRRVGVLVGLFESDVDVASRMNALRDGLQKSGWIEGGNLHIDFRWSATNPDVAREYAKELVALKPDALVGLNTFIAAALQQETRTIPIVFVNVAEPIDSGLVASFARPGGNITGFTNFEPSMLGKWLGLLKEIAPGVIRVAIIFNPKTTVAPVFIRGVESSASSFGIEPLLRPFQSPEELESAIMVLAQGPDGGLVVIPDVSTTRHRRLIIELAARHRLPAVYPYAYFSREGGLMSYGVDSVDVFARSASYIDRVLRGANPADLPVQAPTKFEFVINLKTAKALGVTVPNSMQILADEVIE
jgi:putative tryptophan/tyrosine transport system substrate-binding protein